MRLCTTETAREGFERTEGEDSAKKEKTQITKTECPMHVKMRQHRTFFRYVFPHP